MLYHQASYLLGRRMFTRITPQLDDFEETSSPKSPDIVQVLSPWQWLLESASVIVSSKIT